MINCDSKYNLWLARGKRHLHEMPKLQDGVCYSFDVLNKYTEQGYWQGDSNVIHKKDYPNLVF